MKTLFWKFIHLTLAELALWLTASAWAVTFYDWTAELAYGPDVKAGPADGLRPRRGRLSTLDAIHAAGKAAERDGNKTLADVLGTVALLWAAGSEAAAKAALDAVAEPFLMALIAPTRPRYPYGPEPCRHGVMTPFADKLGPYVVATDCPDCRRFVEEVKLVQFTAESLGGELERRRRAVKAADLRGFTRALKAVEMRIAREPGRAASIVAGMLRAAEVLAAALLLAILTATALSAQPARQLDDLPSPEITPGAVRVTETTPAYPNCPTAYAVGRPMVPPANCPGPVTQAEVCGSTGTKRFRHTAGATKRSVCAAYGITDKAECATTEDDHLIPLVLGGSDDRRNHFPEPWAGDWGAAKKDKLEGLLWRLVCEKHALPLERAWRCIAEEWTKCYVQAQAGQYSEMGR